MTRIGYGRCPSHDRVACSCAHHGLVTTVCDHRPACRAGLTSDSGVGASTPPTDRRAKEVNNWRLRLAIIHTTGISTSVLSRGPAQALSPTAFGTTVAMCNVAMGPLALITLLLCCPDVFGPRQSQSPATQPDARTDDLMGVPLSATWGRVRYRLGERSRCR